MELDVLSVVVLLVSVVVLLLVGIEDDEVGASISDDPVLYLIQNSIYHYMSISFVYR